MDFLRSLWKPDPATSRQEYEPIPDSATPDRSDPPSWPTDAEQTPPSPTGGAETGPAEFSKVAYVVFLLLGVAMLWSWNMFLAAAPYLQTRFQNDEWISANFQSVELLTATVVNLCALFWLAKRQCSKDYPNRILTSLILTLSAFILLAYSTKYFLAVLPSEYFFFVLFMMALTSYSASLCQNGAFAYAAGFGQNAYIRAMMAGHGVAGVLPSLVQTVLTKRYSRSNMNPDAPIEDLSESALMFFTTSVVVSVLSIFAFCYLEAQRRLKGQKLSGASANSNQEQSTQSSAPGSGDGTPTSLTPPPAAPKPQEQIPLSRLFNLTRPYALALFLTFTVTMVFPLFTQRILPTDIDRIGNPERTLSRDPFFISLALCIWNVGDLAGRLAVLDRVLDWFRRRSGWTLTWMTALRIVFVPLYFLCNVTSASRVPYWPTGPVFSNVVYLVFVQFLFGLSNGFFANVAMALAPERSEQPHVQEAIAGFMPVMLVLGLTCGSAASMVLSSVLP